MSIIGEAILTASVDLLVNKLASEGILFFARQEKIQDDLMKWENMLEMIKAVLDDAEEKKTTNRSVKKWLGKLQNLAYDVEDLLDEFQTEAFRRMLLLGNGGPAAAHDQPSSSRTRTSKFRKLIPACCTTFTPQSIQFDYGLMSKIKEINSRFQEIVTQKNLLDLKESSAGGSKKASQRLETTSLVTEAKVYGRETEKKDVVELLLRDDLSNDGGFSVIPIIGMGGLGKTTLAQLVYNDKRVQDHFDLKAWTCVSEDFDVKGLTKKILRSNTEQTIDSDLNLLQEELKKKLSQKKFLLVLDDVWNENYNDWVRLSRPFEAGAKGSKIIVTTRNQEVADIMGTASAYQLKNLSIDDCLAVFAQHSLGSDELLEEIGKKIVAKCDGLPLAAQTLGGLLRGKDRCDWERVLSTKLWKLQEERCDIMPALGVSYYYLSAPLKQCFAYCSLFPKDYEFEEEEIILLWSASGFLDRKEREKTGEDLGRDIFKELQSRSFFQQSSNDASRFVMHDLINDLARWAAGETYFTMEYTSEVNKQQGFSENLRHLSYIPEFLDGGKRFGDLYDIQHLRTFLPVMLTKSSRGYLAPSILPKLLKLRRLRVFSLRGYCIPELPDSIGDLRYLRYLNLSGTKIRTLPESVNKLYNLHSLLLDDCDRLKKLCADMGNLAKLHHLKNSNTKSLEEMPVGIGRLTSLQTLCNFVVGKGSGSGLRELKLLTHLHGTLNISKLENVKDVGDAKEAQLDGKKNLRELLLRWTLSTDCDNIRTLTVEEGIQCSSSSSNRRYISSLLEQLSIYSCPSLTCIFSKNELPATLESIEVGNLPPSLKSLFVWGCSKLESIAERLDNNTSLEIIIIKFCENLKILPSGLHNLRQLQEISIAYCGNLVSFPQGGLSCAKLRTLHITDCKRLEAFPKGLHNLTSLQELTIGGELPSLEEEDGLPTNLHSLHIRGNMEIWKSMIERGRGFHRFSSLRELTIIGCDDDMVSFPLEDKRLGTALPLPASLISLWIDDFPNLERLSSSIVDLQNLTKLTLSNCPKLKYFPEKGLPSLLLQLQIYGCPLIEEKCRKDGGQYWHLLTHIPCVVIDCKLIFVD